MAYHPTRPSKQVFRVVSFIAISLVCLIGPELAAGGWVDPDSPLKARSARALTKGDDRQFELVFSDEFEVEGRTFNDGNDPRWTAIHKNDYTNAALHFYSNENVKTMNGVLNITTERKINSYKAFNEKTKKFYADKKYVQSGMVQSWNKFCITGGIIEFSAKLPGDPSVGGLWPALWLLGNLARATYVGSSDYMWPFSYNVCDQNTRHSQEVDSCLRVAHYGMKPGRGRGAPEIDVLEAMQGDNMKLPNTHIRRPYVSMSLQIAPGFKTDRPDLGKLPRPGHWYSHLEYGNVTKAELNPFFYGVTLVHEPKSYTYQADALSANMQLHDTHYLNQHIYRVEWEPPLEDGSGGYIKWFADGEFAYGVSGRSLDVMGTEIPSEPMYLLMNTAVSSHWGFPAPCPTGCDCECFECGNPDCSCALPSGYCGNFPAFFEIEYVRVYQAVNESRHVLGCSTKDRPTELFIKGHAQRYSDEHSNVPLQPILRGGTFCSGDDDCGRNLTGHCSDRGYCQCYENFTGPNCLAYSGFYDVDTSEKKETFTWSKMMFPTSLCFIALLLVVGFLLSLAFTIRQQRNEVAYQKLSAGDSTEMRSSLRNYTGVVSYQSSARADYAIPQSSQKVITYCVIDDRLIDKP